MRKALRRSLFLSLLLALALPIAWTPAAHGQVELKPGIRVGFNSASFAGDTDEFGDQITSAAFGTGFTGTVEVTEKRRSGLTVGGFLIADFAGPFALQPELRYIQRGYRIGTELTSGLQTANVDQTLRFDYIDIAALARYDIPVSGITPYVIAGPTLGFNVNAEIESETSGNSISGSTETTDVSDTTNGTDLGLEFGAGLEFGLGGVALTADARFGAGISDVNNEVDNITLRNNALMITAGIVF